MRSTYPTFGRVLVTGASGFLGGELVRRLVADGAQVSIVVRAGSRLDHLADLLPRVDVCFHDGSTQQLIALMRKVAPDVVCHLASCFIAEHQSDQVDNLIDSNLRFPTQLLEAMTMAGCLRLVNTGTSWQHFETPAYRPVNLYAATKQAFEDMLSYYADARNLSSITLKLYDTYGPGDQRRKLLRLLMDAPNVRKALDMSPGEQRVDLVHSTDVVEAFVVACRRLLGEQAVLRESYLVSGEALTLRELVLLLSQVGVKVKVNWGARPYRVREVMHPISAEGLGLPGWSASISLIDGLRELAERHGGKAA